MKDKDVLFKALDEFYRALPERLRDPEPAEWKDIIWEKIQGKSDEWFNAFVEMTLWLAEEMQDGKKRGVLNDNQT